MTFPLARSARFDKRRFAKRVAVFAKAASVRMPGLPIMAVAAAAAIVAMTVSGAFRTASMPLGMRAAFWTLLIGIDMAKWQAWFAWRVRDRRDWGRAAAIGAIPLNLLLPIEIMAALRLFGIEADIRFPVALIEALAISGAIFAVMAVVGRRTRPAPAPLPAPIDPPAAAAPCALARIGIVPAALLAVQAEDHYCRFYLDGGGNRLAHFRFGDALVAVAALDGAQIHRGAWIADRGVIAAVRDGRRWRLRLPDGTALPVSPRFTAEARARGWLNRE